MVQNSVYDPAIKMFETMKAEYLKWYMAKESVSLAMMSERESFECFCDWAIKMLVAKRNDV